MKITTFVLLFVTVSPIFAAPTQDKLNGIERQLKEDSDNPMLHYRKCQALFDTGKENESIDHAAITLNKFIKANNNLAWMLLGSFDADQYKVEVIYNMRKSERTPKRDGIVRPYSFRVWTLGDEPQLIRSIDYELAYFDGELISAAIGEMVESGHVNYGTLDPYSGYPTVRKKVLSLLSK